MSNTAFDTPEGKSMRTNSPVALYIVKYFARRTK